MGALAAVVASLISVSPLARVELLGPTDGGCGQPALQTRTGPVALSGAAPGLCVRDAFAARLEPGFTNVVLRVARADHSNGPLRDRIFVYRLEGTHLAPRFLGTGPESRELLQLRPRAGVGAGLDSLEVVLDGPQRLCCRLEEFPLVCREDPR